MYANDKMNRLKRLLAFNLRVCRAFSPRIQNQCRIKNSKQVKAEMYKICKKKMERKNLQLRRIRILYGLQFLQ